MASDGGFFCGFTTFFFSAYSFFGGNARGQEMKGVAILRNELGFGGFFKKERLLFESIIR